VALNRQSSVGSSYFNTELMQNYWTSNAPTAVFTVVDVDSPVTTNDPFATLKTEFATAEELVRASAVLAGATVRGQSAVLADYLAELVPPICFSAARAFFDSH
jgi:hypothetical protein